MNTATKLLELINDAIKLSSDGVTFGSPADVADWMKDSLAALAPPSGEGADRYEEKYATAERLANPAATEDCDFCGVRPGELHAFDCTALDDNTTPHSAPADGDAVQQALLVINDAGNDARHRGDYARANALVRARVTLYRASATPPPASQERGDIRGVNAERREDMSPTGRLRLCAEEDGDMCVMVIADDGAMATVEFCNSGGKSPRTLQALRDLSRAMQADASPPSSAAEASINSPEIDSKLIPDAAEQAKTDGDDK